VDKLSTEEFSELLTVITGFATDTGGTGWVSENQRDLSSKRFKNILLLVSNIVLTFSFLCVAVLI